MDPAIHMPRPQANSQKINHTSLVEHPLSDFITIDSQPLVSFSWANESLKKKKKYLPLVEIFN